MIEPFIEQTTYHIEDNAANRQPSPYQSGAFEGDVGFLPGHRQAIVGRSGALIGQRCEIGMIAKKGPECTFSLWP